MTKNHKELYEHVRSLRGQVWLCAYPNLFITIAPAEWKFYLPYFIQPYLQCVYGLVLTSWLCTCTFWYAVCGYFSPLVTAINYLSCPSGS